MKKILALIGLILWGGMGGALCDDAGQWKCPAQYTPQLTVNGQLFKLLTEPTFDLQKSLFTVGDPNAGQIFLCDFGSKSDSIPTLSFFKILKEVNCSFLDASQKCTGTTCICTVGENCHCLGEGCALTCTPIKS